jgi:hypothetical protein
MFRSSESSSALQKLVTLVEREGPAELASHVGTLGDAEAALKEYSYSGNPQSPLLEFLYRVTAEVTWTALLAKESAGPQGVNTIECANCAARPIISVLREDKAAETVRRSLICMQCSHEWEFTRVLCPNCKEEKPEKLPRYTAQEIPWMRVDACDTYCQGLGKERLNSGCERFCQGGTRTGLPCECDSLEGAACAAGRTLDCPSGTCVGRDTEADQDCQCECASFDSRVANSPGEIACFLSANIRLESSAACDGNHVLFSLPPSCIPLTSATSSTALLQANEDPGAMISQSSTGESIACSAFQQGTTGGLGLVSNAPFFDSLIGDLLFQFSFACR